MPLALIAALAAQAAVAAPPAQIRVYERVAISPDGSQVAALESVEVAGRSEPPHAHLVIRKAADGAVVADLDPCPNCRYDDLAWSPDGARVAVVGRDRKRDVSEVYYAEAGKARVAASFHGLIAKPRFAPDGSQLAILATENPHKESGATQPGAPRVGEIGAAPDERRIAVIPATGGALRLVSPADKFVYEYDWTPDAKGFVATDAVGDGDNNYWVARLEAVDLATGAARPIASPALQIAQPRVSPDGKTVAYIGGLMSDFGSIGGDLYMVPFAGGEARNTTPGFKGSFNALTWNASGLYASALVGDQQTLFLVPASGGMKKLWSEAASVGAADGRLSLTPGGQTAAAMYETFSTAPRIVAGPVGAMKAITHENDAAPSNLEAKSVSWKSDGYDVQGWLLTPKGAQAGMSHPMVVQIHGGPSSAATPRFVWEGTVHALLARGYYIFMPNPRGSYGQGEAFTKANIQDFGGGDLKDDLAGVDAVEKLAAVDDKRLGIMGGSYGGYMTMWTVTQTNRFKAGAAGAGIADWISYYGQNGIDQWMVPFFGGTAYDKPAVYDRLSPIRYIKQAKTPTLIYVGELDVECPPAQSLEFWHGLAAMNVPTSLVIYPGEGHGLRRPANQRDIEARTVAWFDKYLGAAGTTPAGK
jgi:dipeptidyl aminopeptidase/acylaminoacyl peptidase